MSSIQDEIEAYSKMQAALEAEHDGKWALVYQGKLIHLYESFELAAQDALRKFKTGPFLIRQIGERPVRLAASVMYHRDARG